MIGLSFLLRLASVALYAIVFAAILYAAIFAGTWAIRLFIDGVSSTISDHALWLKSKMPKITFKKRRSRKPRKKE